MLFSCGMGAGQPPFRQGPSAAVKLSLPPISFLASAGRAQMCMCGVLGVLWFVGLGVFFEVFLYTCVFEITLKPNTYLCVLLNFCPVLWVMSEAPGVSLALQWIVIIQTILSKKLCYFSPSNVYTPILLP